MIEVLILGPIELRRDGEIVPVPGGKPRAVLAALVVDPTRAVSQDRLIEALWGESTPARAASNLHVHVAALRKLLADDADVSIETTGGGYRLRIDPDRVDAFRFERLVREAHDRTDAAERLHEALALWRGPALAEVADEPFAQTAARRLEESRLAALEQRIDADLALGHHDDLVPELEALVADYPLRERLAGQLMRALYADGRQADALAVYRDLRRRLVDELGLEPGPELQALERVILQHDPALSRPRADRAPPPRRRRLAVAVAILLVLAAAIAAAVIVLGGSSKAQPPPAVVPNSLVQLDPATGRVVSVTPVGDTPVSLAATPRAIWVVNRGDRTVSRVDRRTHAVRTIGGVPFANDIAADDRGNIWVSSSAAPVVTRITDGTASFPEVARPPETIRTPPLAGALAIGAGYLWVTNSNLRQTGAVSWEEVGRDTVSLVDLRSHRLVRSIPAGPIPYAIAVGYGSAWIADYADIGSVSVIRAGSSRAETIPLSLQHDGTPLGITTGAGSVWALTHLGKLIRIDPDTRRIRARVSFGELTEPLMVTSGAGYLWVTARLDYSVVKIDPRSNRVVRRILLGHIGLVPCGILATDTAVWVTIGADNVCGSPA